MTTQDKLQNFSYCAQQVREHDPDRFLLSMVMNATRREALWALFAFNHEIAKTREIVTETQLGLIRLQWWREALQEIYKGKPVREHEVLTALARAIADYELPQDDFEALLYAREFDLEDRRPASLEGLANYADFTTTPLHRLVLRVVGEPCDDAALADLSAGYAMTGLLRAVPYHCAQRRCYLPEDMMAEADIRMDHFFDYKAAEALKSIVREIVAQIGEKNTHKPPKGYMRATKVMSDLYLKQIKRADYNLFDSALSRPPAFFHLRFLWGIAF